MVMVGYNLEKYSRKGTAYLWKAFRCVSTAVRQAKELGEDVQLLDLVEERQMIIDQIKHTLEAQKIHKSFCIRLEEAGYRQITDEDFDKLGAGGLR